jgi:hypothetical protein
MRVRNPYQHHTSSKLSLPHDRKGRGGEGEVVDALKRKEKEGKQGGMHTRKGGHTKKKKMPENRKER